MDVEHIEHKKRENWKKKQKKKIKWKSTHGSTNRRCGRKWCVVVSSVQWMFTMHRHNNCELNAFLGAFYYNMHATKPFIDVLLKNESRKEMGIQSTSFRFVDITHTHTHFERNRNVKGTLSKLFSCFCCFNSLLFLFFLILPLVWPSVCVQCKCRIKCVIGARTRALICSLF